MYVTLGKMSGISFGENVWRFLSGKWQVGKMSGISLVVNGRQFLRVKCSSGQVFFSGKILRLDIVGYEY